MRVDFLDADLLGLPGRIGIYVRTGEGPRGTVRLGVRDLDADLARLRRDHATDLLVCLLEDPELGALGIGALVERAAAHGIDVARLAIADGSVPQSPDDLAALVDRILETARAGRTAVIHCAGGRGRTGLVAACCLVAAGRGPDAAIRAVHAALPGTIEDADQEAFVRCFRARLSRARRSSWQIQPMGERRVELPWKRRLDRAGWERLAAGLVPEQMEDKWFIFEEDGTVHFHRSWTGLEMYEVRFEPDGDGMRAVEAWVEAAAGQDGAWSPEQEATRLDHLVDLLFFGREAPFPGSFVESLARLGRAGAEWEAAERTVTRRSRRGRPK